MSAEDKAQERERKDATLPSALLLLADADPVIADIPNARKRASRVSVESGGLPED